MLSSTYAATGFRWGRTAVLSGMILQMGLMGPFTERALAQQQDARSNTRTPIKHVIVIIGENRSFDHVFATYKPKHGETVDNMLSRRIIKEDGTPGPNYSVAEQYQARDTHKYQINPMSKSVYKTLPPPLVGGPTSACTNNGICTLAEAQSSENGLAAGYYQYMLTGGTGQTKGTPDQRIPNVNNLAPGPFQLSSSTFPYDSYAASPVHRFYQMFQQLDCNVAYATAQNPAGCKDDLFSWVEVTVGAGANGIARPATYSELTTGEGSSALGFYNVQQGDAPYLTSLADNYSMSDNYHQPVKGGTGANSAMLGFGDVIYYSDANGNPAKPPENEEVFSSNPDEAGVVQEVENPNPQPGTNNWYTQDGYGGGGFGYGGPNHPFYGGGSYTNCSDPAQPGVKPILKYLEAQPYEVNAKCDVDHYYMLNNLNPGYFGDGTNASTNYSEDNTAFTIPPTTQRSIGNVLLDAKVSWKYYGDQWNQYLADPYQLDYGTVGVNSDQYCNICNPFQYQTSIMGDPSIRTAHLVDSTELYSDIAAGTLPAVSYVKPSGWVDGHPASSKLILFEGYVKKIVDSVKANPELWKDTAIFITVDEGGGYYDSGYVQAVDYFGDGTRIPLIVVSPYTQGGRISHRYADHVSILKFIEYNWKLGTISDRSRDNLPNPKADRRNPYVPTNSPAIDDLSDMFNFDRR